MLPVATKAGFETLLLLLRGMAFQCCHTQRSIDLITPIFFGDPAKDQLSDERTSVLRVRVRNRKQSRGTEVLPVIAVEPRANRPALSLLFELGAKGDSVQPCCDPEARGVYEDNHYLMLSEGCSSKAFSAIPPEHDGMYEPFLGTTWIMSDFPRTDSAENMEAAYRQKSAYYDHEEACWEWAE